MTSRVPLLASLSFAFLGGAVFAGENSDEPAAEQLGESELAAETLPSAPSLPKRKMISDDGWFDISGFLMEPYGFVPLVIPITEPAIGYGAVAAAIFIQPNEAPDPTKFQRPNITAVGGLKTENGTEGLFVADSRSWKNDKFQTLVAGITASVNLDFHGLAASRFLGDKPIQYNLDTAGGVIEGKMRVGESPVMIGARYSYFEVTSSLADATQALLPPSIPSLGFDTKVGGATLLFTHDTRDNLFTPTDGHLIGIDAAFYDPAIGASSQYQIVSPAVLWWQPLGERWFFGINGSVDMSFGEVPFFQRPDINLRGVPAMRFQGDHTASAEAEIRWQCHDRFSILAFGGVGASWSEIWEFEQSEGIVAGGIGFRYKLANLFGLHAGVDLGFSDEGEAIYIQVGNAWPRS